MSFLLVVFALVLITIWMKQFLSRISSFWRIVKFSKSFKGPGFKELINSFRKGDSLGWLEKLHQRYGSRFCIWFGKNLSLFITDPEDIKFVLGSNKLLSKSKSYTILEPWLKKGILTSTEEIWHKQRKIMTPAFHFKILNEFKAPMEDMCNIMIGKLSEKANGEAFDIYPYVTLLALDIICETAMGIPINAQMQETSECREYVSSVKNVCRLMHKRNFSIWKRNSFLYSFTQDFKDQQRYLDVLHSESRKVIEMRRKTLKTSNIHTLAETEDADGYGYKKRLAFLDILLLAQMDGADLSDEDIQVGVDNIMFAGHDTTSSVISFAIYLLSQHKDIQQKAFEEAVAIKGNEKETMKYLEAVIKETLRLYPSVPFYGRIAMKDVNMRGLTIPKGTSIIILDYAVHRNEKYFPQPESFNPDRFLNDDYTRNPYAYIPFSAGSRNCIGQKFAMMELKIVLAIFLRNFEILPAEGFTPIPLAELVLTSKNGIHVRLKKRSMEI